MRRDYACWLDLADPTGRDPLTARAVTKRWIGAQYDGWPADVEDRWDPTPDVRVSWRVVGHEDDHAFELEWQRPHGDDPTLWQRTVVQIVTSGDGEGSIVVVEWLEAHDRKIRRLPAVRSPGPALVRSLVDNVRCVDGGWAVEATPRAVAAERASELDAFVRGDRRLPVVLVAADGPDRLDAGAADLAGMLVGLAHVVVLEDRRALDAIRDELGADRAPDAGGVRLLWPEWRSSDPPTRHPRWRAEEVSGPGGLREHFTGALRSLVFGAAALRIDEDPRVAMIARAESAQDLAERRAELGRLRRAVAEEGAAMHELVDEYQEELRRADDEVYRLETALEREHELRIRAENAYLLLATGDEHRAPSPGPVMRSLADVVHRAKVELDHLVILPEAERSAREWQYDRVDAAWADLVRLDAVAADWAAGTLPVDFATEARRWGLDWVRDVSDDARQKHVADYRRTYLGRPITLGPHLRRSGRQLLRVYCAFDPERRRLVIGHVGGHLGDRTT